ncbi:hypothetical protein [Streptomyces radicis]|uniref:Thioredoxin domain-containing protein n=1 Tax=Streptomyces radicis TaxID=1750517 RepID=A0A3A9W5H4_9ACTN|nr:hypothetical protein [Streptomyces radicis]RKN04504.1 hypothetical protein D7319_28120 [Streptomyces radicis]RKN15482.1 hypothetical protein D7318_27525 [Streptomyces radicis]
MDFMTSALLVSWVAIALLALVVSGLVRQVHQLSSGLAKGGVARSHGHLGVTPGSAAPHAGELLAEGRDTLLLFLSAECGTCAEVLAEADRLDEPGSAGTPLVRAVYAGAAPATTGATVPVVDHRPDLFTAYDAIATPFAVVVGATGRVVRSEPLGSPAALRELLAAPHPGRPRSA